jgi:hypothetical protein
LVEIVVVGYSVGVNYFEGRELVEQPERFHLDVLELYDQHEAIIHTAL